MAESERQRRHDSGPLLFLLGLVFGLLVALVAERLAATFGDRDMLLLRYVRDIALEEFVEEVAPEQLIDDALGGMLEGLDPYSRFYGQGELAQLNRETTGEFRGIGVVFRTAPPEGQILFAFPGSPAANAGLVVGDRLLEVDGKTVDDMDRAELQRTIQAARDGALVAKVVNLEGQEREVELYPEPVVDPTVRHARLLDAELGIGYLSINTFTQRTGEEFDRAIFDLKELAQREGPGLKSLVIDLRSNLGGILDAAVHVANRFIDEGTIVSTRTRGGTEVTDADPDLAELIDLPTVVLVDEGSASASEVLAGALQDHSVAALIGEATYGKGTVQTLRQFADDRGVIKLTTARYYTPSGRGIERDETGEGPSGIAPDHLVEMEDEERLEVYRFLSTYSPPPSELAAIEEWEHDAGAELRPRPPEDRQLEAALALLQSNLSGAAGGDEPRAY